MAYFPPPPPAHRFPPSNAFAGGTSSLSSTLRCGGDIKKTQNRRELAGWRGRSEGGRAPASNRTNGSIKGRQDSERKKPRRRGSPVPVPAWLSLDPADYSGPRRWPRVPSPTGSPAESACALGPSGRGRADGAGARGRPPKTVHCTPGVHHASGLPPGC